MGIDYYNEINQREAAKLVRQAELANSILPLGMQARRHFDDSLLFGHAKRQQEAYERLMPLRSVLETQEMKRTLKLTETVRKFENLGD